MDRNAFRMQKIKSTTIEDHDKSRINEIGKRSAVSSLNRRSWKGNAQLRVKLCNPRSDRTKFTFQRSKIDDLQMTEESKSSLDRRVASLEFIAYDLVDGRVAVERRSNSAVINQPWTTMASLKPHQVT